MANAEEQKILIRKRASIKQRVTHIKNFVDAFLNKPTATIDEHAILDLDQRLSKLSMLSPEFDAIQLEIEVASEEFDAQLKERENFDTLFMDLVSTIKRLLSKYTSISEPNNSAQSSTMNAGCHVKLPQIQLPKFSGSYDSWSGFRDTFVSLIHNSNISGIQKFHYLRASLEGVAAELIRSLEFSDDNYTIAWDMLCTRFNNKRLIVHSHIRALHALKSLTNESARELRKLLDDYSKHIRSLEVYKQPTTDTLLIHLIVSKLDRVTLREWEQQKWTGDFPTLEELTEFLRTKANVIEATEAGSPAESSKHLKMKQKIPILHATTERVCIACKGGHLIYSCPRFSKFTTNERLDFAKGNKLCINCLKTGHLSRDCKSGSCRKCNGRHNTLLHFETKRETTEPSPSTSTVLTSHTLCEEEESFWPTARVEILDKDGQVHECIALLDSCSQSNFITSALCKKLNLQTSRVNIAAHGVGGIKTNINSRCNTKIQSPINAFKANVSCLVVNSICKKLPSSYVGAARLNIPRHLKLADPQFNHPKNVDLLIGNKLFFKLLCIGQVPIGEDILLQKTQFGWIVSGGTGTKKTNQVQCYFTKEVDIQEQLQKFWEIEESPHIRHLSSEEDDCEQHFKDTVSRDNTGRFIVRLPLKESPEQLGESRQQAMKRFLSLERKLQTNPKLKEQYVSFMKEYEDLGHMTKITGMENNIPTYYLPHHGVLREDSLTTKLRVVFDGSAPSSTGYSVNDLQKVGPVIQEDLLSIILRFRQHRFAITADIEKMYRQVLLAEDQRPLQRILWRSDPNQELDAFELNTVTYGTTSASYLAIRCLFELADQSEADYPKASQVIKRDFYVDDLITGSDTIEEASLLSRQIYEVLRSGGFILRKWTSSGNAVPLHQSNDKPSLISLGTDKATKTLGLLWQADTDHLTYAIPHERIQGSITKRMILSKVAQIFDPLGLISPCTVIAKIILQKLWQFKLTWDESIPMELHTEFLQFYNNLSVLNTIEIPRHVLCVEPTFIELHGFADASENAYGCCVYIRSFGRNFHVSSTLICAKTRVAPLKSLSVPRLELCGAQLLVHLVRRVREATTIPISKSYLYSDSTIVLAWINTSPHLLKTFVANRVSEIQRRSESADWHHICTSENPADLASRGAYPTTISKYHLWWHGPQWLIEGKSPKPYNNSQPKEEPLPEMKGPTVACLNSTTGSNFPFSRYSTLVKLQRVTAICLRFVKNCRTTKEKRATGSLMVVELENSLKKLLRQSQAESFPTEISTIASNPGNLAGSLSSLNPFLCPDGLLRVGGRLGNTNFAYNKKHPLVLSAKHPLTHLIFKHEHLRLLHAGPQLLLANLRETYWPISGRNLARKTVRSCVKCFRVNPRSVNPIMGNLPASRLQPASPFQFCGVDYAGPFTTKDRLGRGAKTYKSYICLFVCFVTKAIHLELVSDLTTESFIAALRRFSSRRGKPSHIYSDNGTNFVGANNELQDLYKFLHSNNDPIQTHTSTEGIQWHFIPAHSPHFGGVWEAGVKSTKAHLQRVIGTTILTFEHYYTFLTQVEAVLNSRPLSPLSTDPHDMNPLTPSHLLIGKQMTSIPDPDVKHIAENRLSRYQRLQQMLQHYWTRWSKEYVSELQQRLKWKRDHPQLLQVGSMVVIKEDNFPPLKWQLGRVTELHPGSDGVLRVVSVRIPHGKTIKRAIHKLCVLPMEE